MIHSNLPAKPVPKPDNILPTDIGPALKELGIAVEHFPHRLAVELQPARSGLELGLILGFLGGLLVAWLCVGCARRGQG